MQVRLLGVHQPRAYRDHPHLGRPLHRQRLHQCQHPRFRRAIRRRTGRGTQRTDTADKHDAAAVCLLLHKHIGLLSDIQRCNEVEANNALVKPRRHRCGVRCRAATGVVDHHIKAPKISANAVEQSLERLHIPHIGGPVNRLCRTHLRQCVRGCSTAHNHLRPCFQKAAGNACTDAFSAAGDEHYLTAVVQP